MVPLDVVSTEPVVLHKDVTPDAVDISDLTAAKEAATQAENERRIVEMERKRLRMEAEKEGR
jgi:hypothetical protein